MIISPTAITAGTGVFDVSAFECVDWLKLGKFFFFKAIIMRGKPSAVIGKFFRSRALIG